VLRLEALFRMLDELRAETIGMVESPADGDKNSFGFGRVAGMFFILSELRGRIDAIVEEANRQEEERANQ
jgi:hypothetical protein